MAPILRCPCPPTGASHSGLLAADQDFRTLMWDLAFAPTLFRCLYEAPDPPLFLFRKLSTSKVGLVR